LKYKSLITRPQGLIGKAVSYTLIRWDRLVDYLEDGDVKAEKNLAENAIRPLFFEKNLFFLGCLKKHIIYVLKFAL